jgi:hypothetical protein
MLLPRSDHLRVDREKITDYLLSTSHPDGQAKAEFLKRFGFLPERWEVLAKALRKHGADLHIVTTVESSYGTRYAVDGVLETPDGRNPHMRTVWMLEKGGTTPRLITAHPLEVPA